MTRSVRPRITFGMIVFNGEPFTRYCLRGLYPFAHQIIVVEGACKGAATMATPDGHSSDGTVQALGRFKAEEDPDDKLTVVTAEDDGHPNGFWPGEKDEQSRAYARRATGEYLWQVDVDEFHKPEDMQAILDMLNGDPAITSVPIPVLTFWGGFGYLVDGFWLRRFQLKYGGGYPRLFKWGSGYQYAGHRPPTVLDEQGRNLRSGHSAAGRELARRGIFMYHYSLLFPKQMTEKCEYRGSNPYFKSADARRWGQDSYLKLCRPFRVFYIYSEPSWLERFRGTHPPQIAAMRQDIRTGRLRVDLRRTDDIERLLRSPAYCVRRGAVKFWEVFERHWNGSWRPWRRLCWRLMTLPFRAVHKTCRLLDGMARTLSDDTWRARVRKDCRELARSNDRSAFRAVRCLNVYDALVQHYRESAWSASSVSLVPDAKETDE